MAEENVQPRQNPTPSPKKPGLFLSLFWHLPWKIIGILLVSLLVSLLIEFVGMTFVWIHEGAEHSRQVVLTESGYLSQGFIRSLLMSAPVTVITGRISQAYQWLFVDSGFISWLNAARQTRTHVNADQLLNQAGRWLAVTLWDYLQAARYGDFYHPGVNFSVVDPAVYHGKHHRHCGWPGAQGSAPLRRRL